MKIFTGTLHTYSLKYLHIIRIIKNNNYYMWDYHVIVST